MKHFRPLVLVSLTLAVLVSACSQVPEGARGLEPQFGTALDDRAEVVATDSQRGAVYVAGVDSNNPEEFAERGGNVFLRRYSRGGTLIWQKRLFSTSYEPRVNGLDTDAFGNIYMGWSVFSTDGYLDAALLKFDPSGRQLYRVDLDNGIRDFELDAKGNAYIAGLADRDGAVDLEYVRKYNAQGGLMWGRARVYESFEVVAGSNVPTPDEVSPAADGSLYVRGYIDGGSVLTKYSNTGRSLWQRSLPGNLPISILSASGNDVYLTTRRVEKGPTGNVAVRKYDASGRLVLDGTLPGTEAVSANALRLDKSGNIYLVGSVARADHDLFVRKYTTAFNPLWTYAPRFAGTADFAGEVALKDGRSVFVAGGTTAKVNSKNYGGQDAFLLHLNTQGSKVWSR